MDQESHQILSQDSLSTHTLLSHPSISDPFSEPVATQLKNHFQYEILDSSSSSSTEDGADSRAVSRASTLCTTSSSDEDNTHCEEDSLSISSAASLIDFSDVTREKRVSAALAPNHDSVSVSSNYNTISSNLDTSLGQQFGVSLRKQLETDMNSILNTRSPDNQGDTYRQRGSSRHKVAACHVS